MSISAVMYNNMMFVWFCRLVRPSITGGQWRSAVRWIQWELVMWLCRTSVPMLSILHVEPVSISHTHTHTNTHTHTLVFDCFIGKFHRRSVFIIPDALYFLSPYPNPTPHTKLSAILDFQTSFCMIYELVSSLGPTNKFQDVLLLLLYTCRDIWSP